jgi:hypothetical protein
MCDGNNEAVDQIHAIATHLFSELTGEISDEKKKRLRHGLNLIISLSGFMDDRVTEEDLAALGMGSPEGHAPHEHEHAHGHEHGHAHNHDHSHKH